LTYSTTTSLQRVLIDVAVELHEEAAWPDVKKYILYCNYTHTCMRI
jgi:hypothetical protein